MNKIAVEALNRERQSLPKGPSLSDAPSSDAPSSDVPSSDVTSSSSGVTSSSSHQVALTPFIKSRFQSNLQEVRAKQKSRKIIIKTIILIFVLFLCIFIGLMHIDGAFAIGNNETPILNLDGSVKTDKEGNVLMKPITGNVLNGIYYWATTTSTVGFGDICPKSAFAKIMTAVYQVFLVAVTLGSLSQITNGKLKEAISILNLKKRLSADGKE